MRSKTRLVGQQANLLENGAQRPAPLSAAGEGNDAVAAHVVTAAHDRPAGRPNLMTITDASQQSTGSGQFRISRRKDYLIHVPSCISSLDSMIRLKRGPQMNG